MVTQEQPDENEQRFETSATVSRRDKLQILKEGRTTNLTISQVCDQHQISPTLFYQWERIADRALGAR